MKCKYCKKPAGFLSTKHKECEIKHKESLSVIKTNIKDRFITSVLNDYLELKQDLSDIISDGFVSDKEFDSVIFETALLVLNNEIEIDIFVFHNFIESITSDLRKSIISCDRYKTYLTKFFNTYFDSLDIDVRVDNSYITLIKRIKSVDGMDSALYDCFTSFLDNKISYFLEDNLIDDAEEAFLTDLIDDLSLREYPEFNQSKVYKRLVQCLILKDLKEGKEITRLQIQGLPILLGKKEQVLWIDTSIEGSEEKTGKRYEGASKGVSIRICKGVYYRTAASKGYPVEYQYNKSLGIGSIVITNKHVYFLGDKQVKLPYTKIISFEEYSDGITLIKDGVNPKPYTFVGIDAWFLINAIQLSNV